MVRTSERTAVDVELEESDLSELRDGGSVSFRVGDTEVSLTADVSEDEPYIPNVGEIMHDPESPHWSDGRVEIEEVTNVPASGYLISGHTTVWGKNPDYPKDDPVIEARYIRPNDKRSGVYAFPASRLEKVDDGFQSIDY